MKVQQFTKVLGFVAVGTLVLSPAFADLNLGGISKIIFPDGSQQATAFTGAKATGTSATISGGSGNVTTANNATVGGGLGNSAGDTATVGGGGSNLASGVHATISGGWDNTASAQRATVSGGAWNVATGSHASIGGGASNEASALNSAIAGGNTNRASAAYTAIGGGQGNLATDEYSTVGGGVDNLAGDNTGLSNSAGFATVGGGESNDANALYATVGGGHANMASGVGATVPGGELNSATGDFSFAAGYRAQASEGGSFVWADRTNADFNSMWPDSFAVRADGGVRFQVGDVGVLAPENGPVHWIDFVMFNALEGKQVSTPQSLIKASNGAMLSAGGNWVNNSDSATKENVERVDGRAVLEKLSQVPVSTWNYKTESDSARHMGPMAQDLYEAFQLGGQATAIGTIDADGIALAAIQGLNQKLTEELAAKEAAIAALESRLQALEKAIAAK